MSTDFTKTLFLFFRVLSGRRSEEFPENQLEGKGISVVFGSTTCCDVENVCEVILDSTA